MKLKKWIRQNPHCLAWCYYIFYLIAFFLLEKFAVPRFIIYSPLDDLIPFNEWFLIPYCLWFLVMPGSLFYFMLRDKEAFLNECFLMFTGMTFCLFIYLILPNGLNLRIDVPDRNILAHMVIMLQNFDAPTNVCPSIHVASALAVDISVQKSRSLHKCRFIRAMSFVIMIFILLSTMFLKQHSVIDVVLGILLTLILSLITYNTRWAQLLQKTPLRVLWQEHL